jgi:hypothetical protein
MSVKRTAIAGAFMLRQYTRFVEAGRADRDCPHRGIPGKEFAMPQAAVARKVAPYLTHEFFEGIKNDEEIMNLVLTPGGLLDLVDVVVTDPALTAEERAYLESVPVALQEAIRATIAAAINEGKEVQVQFSPAYDFGLHLWDYGEAISVHLAGPYTNETMPEYLKGVQQA